MRVGWSLRFNRRWSYVRFSKAPSDNPIDQLMCNSLSPTHYWYYSGHVCGIQKISERRDTLKNARCLRGSCNNLRSILWIKNHGIMCGSGRHIEGVSPSRLNLTRVPITCNLFTVSIHPLIDILCVCVCVCVFSSHSFWTSSSLDVPAGVTQEEGHTGFFIHLLSAVRALIFLARRIQPFLSIVDREVEFCVLTI